MDFTLPDIVTEYLSAIKTFVDKEINPIADEIDRQDSIPDQLIEKILKQRKKPVAVMTAGGKFSQQHKKHLENHGLSTFASPFVAAEALKALTLFALKK